MAVFYFLIGILLVCGVTSQTYYTCDYVNSFPNCNLFITDSYCGTNRVTYANKCEFSKAHCADPTIDLLHIGDCTTGDMSTVKPVAGSDVLFDFFCTALSKQDCPTDVSNVCASDGRTYINYCEYEKQKCTHRDLAVVSYGTCVV